MKNCIIKTEISLFFYILRRIMKSASLQGIVTCLQKMKSFEHTGCYFYACCKEKYFQPQQ